MAVLPAGTREIRIEVTKGDWLTLSEIRISPYPRPPKQVVLQPRDMDWGLRQGAYMLDYGKSRWSHGRDWRTGGVGVLVGEWGAHDRTPHHVVLGWMKDCLENWKRANMGWALWNLRGSFGILDSERADVAYEAYKGHTLDRKMLELLKEG